MLDRCLVCRVALCVHFAVAIAASFGVGSAYTLPSASGASGQTLSEATLFLRRERQESAYGSEPDSHQVPSTCESEPLLTCESLQHSTGADPWITKWQEGVKGLCRADNLKPFVKVYLDQQFRDNYNQLVPKNGWLEEAYVNYVKVYGAGTEYGRLTEALVDSVHRFSSKPIVVVNFGKISPPELADAATRFPRLLLLHARSVPNVSFNFNKLLAILLARVKVGISADSDMMIGPHADQLFARTSQEVNQAYPYPMMPTHYLDRDVDNRYRKRPSATNFLEYSCDGCPRPSMRWGQAQPTWTYWAFPFVGRWLTAKYLKATLLGVHTASINEDEDLLNVALWAENATKAWCMFQSSGIDWVEQNFFPQHTPGPEPYYDDPSRFPEGVPIGFYMSHGERNAEKVHKAIELLQKKKEEALHLPALFHKKRFYKSFAELQADSPGLRCIL